MQTEVFTPTYTGAKLITVEARGVRSIALDSRERWSFGRVLPGYPVDIPFESSAVSRNHGMLFRRNDQWYISCRPDTTNATYYNGKPLYPQGPRSEPVSVPIHDGDILRIDGPSGNGPDQRGVAILFTTSEITGRWAAYPLIRTDSVFIGRDPRSCGIVQPFPYVSAVHAKIERIQGRYYLSDCGSKSGTWLNRSWVTGRVLIQEKDRIGIGDRSLFLVGDSIVYDRQEEAAARIGPNGQQAARPGAAPTAQTKPIILSARIRSKWVKDSSGARGARGSVGGRKELLRNINVDIREGTLVALLGTAGAGKSTLMNCLNGMETAGLDGRVLYRGQDLVQNFNRLQYMIGSVPQKKTFHPTYTPEQELTDAAYLRLPGNTTRKEIRQVVDQTIRSLHMESVRQTKNSRLSGGEQTRVNLGIELVADRSFLCLDEPDQGLSPDLKHEVFEILRELAHREGKCILAIIHDVSEIEMFDQVIILVKAGNVGRLAFSGTPKQAETHFGVPIKSVYALLERDPARFVV